MFTSKEEKKIKRFNKKIEKLKEKISKVTTAAEMRDKKKASKAPPKKVKSVRKSGSKPASTEPKTNSANSEPSRASVSA